VTLPVAISQVLNGIAFGMLLFLLAAGLSLMFGLMGVVNLAHGASIIVQISEEGPAEETPNLVYRVCSLSVIAALSLPRSCPAAGSCCSSSS